MDTYGDWSIGGRLGPGGAGDGGASRLELDSGFESNRLTGRVKARRKRTERDRQMKERTRGEGSILSDYACITLSGLAWCASFGSRRPSLPLAGLISIFLPEARRVHSAAAPSLAIATACLPVRIDWFAPPGPVCVDPSSPACAPACPLLARPSSQSHRSPCAPFFGASWCWSWPCAHRRCKPADSHAAYAKHS